MAMKASAFEFKNRFWIILGGFAVAFSFYALGDVNLAQALSVGLGGGAALAPMLVIRTLLWLAALLSLLCALLRTWAAAYLSVRTVHGQSLDASRLVADGPYRHLRNPLYLGSILLALAFVPLTSRFGAPVLVAWMTIFVWRLIGREEEELLASQGEPYRRYRDAVPALIPSLRPRLPASGARPRWAQAFAGEAMMWGLFAALSSLAWTLRARLYGIALALAILASLIVKAVVWRTSSRTAAEPRA
jgi:protein-S-isoprenylcysteine O-methyltransferase Ste14